MIRLSVARAVVACLLVAPFFAFLWFYGARVEVVVVPCAVVTLLFGYSALTSADDPVAAFPVMPEQVPPPSGRDRRLSHIAWSLQGARDDATWARRLRPQLGRLAVDRLRDRQGIDAVTDPDAARAALGPDLWALATGELPPPRTTTALAGLVERIHQL